MDFGFCVQGTPEQTKFSWSPGKDSEKKPSLVNFYRDRKIAAVVVGRIYYQKDGICSKVLGAKDQKNNASKVLSVYRKFEKEGLEQLEGDFALVLWDGNHQKLIAMRDVIGSYPLYWTRNNSVTAISTSIRYLASLLPSLSLDYHYFARYLTHNLDEELPIPNTPFTKINRLLPGKILEISNSGENQKQYWFWEDKIEDQGKIELESAGEELLHLINNAVQERMEGDTSTHLSGGMDSTTVSMLAARYLDAGVKTGRLQTLSATYNNGKMAEESVNIDIAIDTLSKFRSPITCSRINSDENVDFDNFEEQPLSDEPRGSQFRLLLFLPLINAALNFGSATILTGIFAEPIVDGNSLYIADQIRKGKLRAAFRETSRWAKARNTSFHSILIESGLKPIFPLFMETGISFTGYGNLSSIGDYDLSPWINKKFAQKYKLRSLGKENAYRRNKTPCDRSIYLSAITSIPQWMCWDYTAPYDVHTAHPFSDPRIISFCLGIPHHVKSVPGKRKVLLQTAMKGILPEKIRTRYDKGNFNYIYYRGLEKNLIQLQQMVVNSSINELGIFETEELTKFMRQVAMGRGNINGCDRLNRSLALIAWFNNLKDFTKPQNNFTYYHNSESTDLSRTAIA